MSPNSGNLLATWETPPKFKITNPDHCQNSTAAQQLCHPHGYAQLNSLPISGVHPQQLPCHLPLNGSSSELLISCPPPYLEGPLLIQYPPPKLGGPPSLPVPPYNLTPNPHDLSTNVKLLAPRQGRARNACDQCRKRKAKCDENRPVCYRCKENSLNCKYGQVPPRKEETAVQSIFDKIDALEIDALSEKIDALGEKINAVLDNQKNTSPVGLGVTEPSIPHQSSIVHNSLAENVDLERMDDHGIRFPARNVGEDEMVEDEDGELSIPVEHTTAAHNLLQWPSLRRILKKFDQDYVMNMEEARGPIRLHWHGEEKRQSDYDQSARSPSTANRALNPNWNDDCVGVGTPDPPRGVGSPMVIPPNRHREQLGGLDDLGLLNTSPDTVRRLYKNYMIHFHILHPFLDEDNLTQMVDYFIEMYRPFPKKSPAGSYVPTSSDDRPHNTKRRRLSKNLQAAPRNTTQSSSQPTERGLYRRIEGSIDNAIVLFVLALGSMCEWRERPLPRPWTDPVPSAPDNGCPSPAMSDFALPHTITFYSPGVQTQESNEYGHPKNMELIPGLAYYAHGTDILGSPQGGYDLPHVQAFLLAALYAGQLAHPFESHGWISQASRAFQVLVRRKRYESMKDESLKDLCNFTYWTCLQLDSDILAELDLPASGISRLGGRIALPKGVSTLTIPNEIHAPGTMMMFFYTAQIHLRKFLNCLHRELYQAEEKGQTQSPLAVYETLGRNLELWRAGLPNILRWNDGDPPSNDINTARMRAKYYGARYIIYRPLLYRALHTTIPKASNTVDSPTGPSDQESSKSQYISPPTSHSRTSSTNRWSSNMEVPGHPHIEPWFGIPYSKLSPKLKRACKICIESAILSTEAFDGIKGRLVVTNIFGTAHAQFGNMLVLSATYLSSLSELVNQSVLQRLLQRTIDFLLRNMNTSPSLYMDANILAEIYWKIFSESPTRT